MTILTTFLVSVIILLGYGPVFSAGILNIRHFSAPDSTRVVIETTEGLSYSSEQSAGRVSLLFPTGTLAERIPRELTLMKSGVNRITAAASAGGSLVEVFLLEGTAVKVFKLQAFEGRPERVVIDVVCPEVENQLADERQTLRSQLKKRIIVIDPGHGGDDPGAVGKRGTQEKDVVLEIGKRLKEILDREEGFRAFLTRDGDYYVPFKKRMKIARDLNADLFLSIHTDASTNRRASGSSVYTLSTGGAVSEASRILARKENLADIVGGIPEGELIPEDSTPIILDMLQNNTINTSKNFGASLLSRLGEGFALKYSSVQEAPFVVLKLPEIPAVLIETLFISNPLEERRLRNKDVQNAFARKIAQTVTEFFSGQDAAFRPAKATAAKREEVPLPGREEIPQSKASPSPGKEDPLEMLTIGQGVHRKEPQRTTKGATAAIDRDKAEIRKKKPAPPEQRAGHLKARGKAASPNVKAKSHLVKKGETLERIALRHQTSIRELARINGIKKGAPIHPNQRLKLPEKNPLPKRAG